MSNIDPAAHLLSLCGALQSGERFLLVVDASTQALAERFLTAARVLGAHAETAVIPVADRHGAEPPPFLAPMMQQADLVAGLTFKSLAHTRTRLAFTEAGGRYLSLPGYSESLLRDPAITADFHAQFERTRRITEAFTAGSRVRVATAAGTDIQLDIAGRVGNCCPGFVSSDYRLGSPPDIESNVSPVEDASEGIVVVDGSVACEEIGLLRAPITLHVAGGRIRRFESEIPEYVETCERLFARVDSPLAYVLAECGVGLNPAATLTGNMLTDEGVLGCVHFGFGSNATVGGLNDVPFHIDFVFRQASLWIDGQPILLYGEPVIG